ncbi:MAG: AAA family ATPase [Bacilli bacterium]|nr:AAA family ATPase [Bacilli bacterium]
MIREEYIGEIKKQISSARIEKIYTADCCVKENKESKLHYPDFDDVFSYVMKANNSEKFFDKIFAALDNYKKHVEGNNTEKQKVSFEPLSKRVELSDATINKLLKEISLEAAFSKLADCKIEKAISLSFDETLSDSLNFLFDLLDKLSKKAKDYIVKNSIYSNAYRVGYEENVKKLKSKEPLTILAEVNESVKKIVDKKYIPDFLSDGSEDLEEMMTSFWSGFSALLYFTKPSENVSYLVNGKEIKNIKDWFKTQLDAHYEPVNNIIRDSSFMASFSDAQVRDAYEKIIKIKVPKEINPRSESDLANEKGKAEKKLAELIGLDSVKQMIDKIKAYTKAAKGKSGLNLHMAFYGNPGTGKTEVAKLIGEILYENGVLPKKKYVEATRSTLVAGYVGQTALKTQYVMEEAMGGVLFIDEAYSLAIEGDSQDFGNEAVAELIKGMEDNKGKFCVILAGYKNKMQKMLSTNPGFNSRIQFHVDFENYSRDELSEIMKMMVEKDGYIVEESALNKMLDITDVLRKNPDFANARDARNIVQQCEMCLNVRTGDENDKTILIEDVNKYIKDAKLALPTGSAKSTEILSGEDELNSLIGLNSVKMAVKKIRAYAKKNKGSLSLNLHMAFTGNPGTGKTEVANIISRILFEAGVLPEAKVIVGNRETLVGQYVGQTAIKTKEAIEKAMGGVLFIDEAYSLISDNGGSHDFGSEAIAALIDGMENNKGKFCVIVAGYDEPLRKMIASNPGFGSRIQFWVDFPDYSHDELKDIALRFLSKETVPYTITEEALEEMLSICEFYRHNDDFANARTVRTMLQDIIMNQNLRVEDELDNNEITIEDVEQYANDKGLVKTTPKKETQTETALPASLLDTVLNAGEEFDSSKVDYSYYNQAVISISNENGGQGTGFIITDDGLCLTCAHCICTDGSMQKARLMLALADGQFFKNYVDFDVLYLDKKNDFALIRLANVDMKFKFLPLKSIDSLNLEPLTPFLMAGYPFGGESYTSISVTEGKIASVNVVHEDRRTVFADMFGKPGNSGSPILDYDTKKVIGVFWGGISNGSEMIPCFTPVDEILKAMFPDSVRRIMESKNSSVVELTGDALGNDCDVLCHQVNLQGVMGGGIALHIANRFPSVEREYAFYGNKALGEVCFAKADKYVIANCFSQTHSFDTDYEALAKCLDKVVEYMKLNNLHSVAIPYKYGCGIANGDWNTVRSIFVEKLKGFTLKIYKLK